MALSIEVASLNSLAESSVLKYCYVAGELPVGGWGKRATTKRVRHPPNVLGVSCAAGPACRSRSGAAVAANDVRRTEWRTATAVTPSRWRCGRQLGCRAEAGPHQLHTKVRPSLAAIRSR
jgi:hypothetical protein